MGRAAEVAHQWQDLVRGSDEPRWTAVVDAVLAFGVMAWVLFLGFVDPGRTLQLVVPLAFVIAVVARLVVLVEYSHRGRESPPADVQSAGVDRGDERPRGRVTQEKQPA